MKGNRLKLLRDEKGLTQEDLAKIIDVSPSAIGMYERDEREPNDDLTLKLADYFGVSTDYILGKSDIQNSTNTNNTYEEKELLKYYQKLNNLGKQTAITYVEGLTEVPKFTEKRKELKNA